MHKNQLFVKGSPQVLYFFLFVYGVYNCLYISVLYVYNMLHDISIISNSVSYKYIPWFMLRPIQCVANQIRKFSNTAFVNCVCVTGIRTG